MQHVLNVRTLDVQHAVSLQQYSAAKSEQQLKVEAQAKEILKEQPVKTVGNSSTTPAQKPELRFTGSLANFSFIKDIEGLSTVEKRHIDRLVLQSTQKPAGGTDSYFTLDRAQANAQLQLIRERLIPEQYQDEMKTAIDNFMQEERDVFVSLLGQMQANMDKLRAQYPSLNESTILVDGTKRLQQEEATAAQLYSGLDFSSQSNFVQSFENVLAQFKTDQLKAGSQAHVLSDYQDQLRTKWNNFATLLNDASVYKLPTTQQSLIDMRL